MPKVTTSTFRCPICKSATKVLRTRSIGPSRLTRYRVCVSNSDHRFATREICITEPAAPERAIGTTSIRFALLDLARQFGISLESISSPIHTPDNQSHGEHDHAHDD